MKTLPTNPCNKKTSGSGTGRGCIIDFQCVWIDFRDVQERWQQQCPRTLETVHWAQSYLRVENIDLKNRLRHKRLLPSLRRAVADLPSCYCRIAWSYAKEKSGLRFRSVRDTYIGHVSNSVGMSNRIPWSCSTGSLGHVSNSATFQLGQFESIGHVSGHVRGHVQNHFLKFFYVFFERFLKSVKCDWYMTLGPRKSHRKSVSRNL